MPAHPDKPTAVPTRYPSVLLLHESSEGNHYDWLLADPNTDDPDARLWTARTLHPSRDWAGLGSWELEPIAPHRREYLQYEGPISNNRGTVKRIDEGWFTTVAWEERRIQIDLHLRDFQGRLELTPTAAGHWLARVIGETKG